MVKPKLGNLLVLGIGEVATRGFSFLAFSYLGHHIAPEDMGIYGSALAVMMFGTLALDQGFGIHGARGIARDSGSTDLLVRRIVSAQLWLATAVYAILWIVTALFDLDPTLVTLIRGLGLTLFAAPFLLNWVFQGRNEMLWFTLPTALRQLTFFVLVYALIDDASDLTLLPVAEVSGAALAAFVFVFAFRRNHLSLPIDLSAGFNRELFREALPIGASNLIWALRTYLPVLVFLGVLGSRSAGFFEPGHRIILVFVAFLGVYFTNVFPAMSAAAHHAKDELAHLIQRALWISTGATTVIATLTTFTASLMIEIVVGAQYVNQESVNSMVLLSWLLPILAWRRCARTGLIVLDRQRIELKCSLIGLALLVALIFPLAAQYGLIGGVSAILISEFTATALTWFHFRSAQRECQVENDNAV